MVNRTQLAIALTLLLILSCAGNPPTATPTPLPTIDFEALLPSVDALPYNPHGPDRDCGDFSSLRVAKAFYEAAGGPRIDPHRLDGDGDGIPCELWGYDGRRDYPEYEARGYEVPDYEPPDYAPWYGW